MTKGRKGSKGEGEVKTTVREGEKEARKRKEKGEAGGKRKEETRAGEKERAQRKEERSKATKETNQIRKTCTSVLVPELEKSYWGRSDNYTKKWMTLFAHLLAFLINLSKHLKLKSVWWLLNAFPILVLRSSKRRSTYIRIKDKILQTICEEQWCAKKKWSNTGKPRTGPLYKNHETLKKTHLPVSERFACHRREGGNSKKRWDDQISQLQLLQNPVIKTPWNFKKICQYLKDIHTTGNSKKEMRCSYPTTINASRNQSSEPPCVVTGWLLEVLSWQTRKKS